MEVLNSILGSAWTVLAALIGTCGALIGVILSVWNSRKQLRLQLEQQGREFKLGREMNLRRDVYLEAAVAVARATGSLTELADVTRSSNDLARQFATDYAAIAKVHVVGAPDTIEALIAVTGELGKAQAELNARRIPLLGRQHRIDSGGIPAEQLGTLLREQTEARLDIAELAMSWARKVALHIPPAVIAIRKELDLPLGEEAYRQSFERTWENSLRNLRLIIDTIRSEMSDELLPESVVPPSKATGSVKAVP
jgi:hypothetical protein